MEGFLNEYEAALFLHMSPTLLRWFTSHAPKNDKIKLSCKVNEGVYYYSKEDLEAFDLHLNTPWEKPPKGQRPNIPAGIKSEIAKEALFRCPVCNANSHCELAHIKPVSTTLNNHPHNLIYLCPNHHSEYDYGHRYSGVDEEVIIHYKKGLQYFQATLWSFQQNIVSSYLQIINRIGRLKEIEDLIPTIVDQDDFKKIFSQVVAKLEKAEGEIKESKQKIDKIIAPIKEQKANLNDKDYAYSFLHVKSQITDELDNNKHLKRCPLCNGRGATDYFEVCPVCEGDSFIAIGQVVDLEKYALEECPLCDGKGSTEYYDVCPPCGGEGRLTKELIDSIDFEKYDIYECPICDGQGFTNEFEVCPPCGGDGYLSKEQRDSIDFTQFDFIECAICEGQGATSDFEVCPACKGEGKLTREIYEKTDFAQYKLADCPLCEGQGSTSDFDTCPACRGEGKLTREQIAATNFERYELYVCPVCSGNGSTSDFDTCPAYYGVGHMTEEQFDRTDFDQFRFSECPLCKGKGSTYFYDVCPPCSGEGRIMNVQLEKIDFSQFKR